MREVDHPRLRRESGDHALHDADEPVRFAKIRGQRNAAHIASLQTRGRAFNF
jgi:hypothetical protein